MNGLRRSYVEVNLGVEADGGWHLNYYPLSVIKRLFETNCALFETSSTKFETNLIGPETKSHKKELPLSKIVHLINKLVSLQILFEQKKSLPINSVTTFYSA